MLYETNLIKAQERKELLKKVEKLCKKNNCSVAELIVLSIDYHAQNKKNNIEG